MNTNLSRQEIKILSSLSTGNLYKEIATEQNISVNTVKKHLKNIYRKINVRKRKHAAEMYHILFAAPEENNFAEPQAKNEFMVLENSAN